MHRGPERFTASVNDVTHSRPNARLYTDERTPNRDDLEQRCGYKQAPGKGQYDSVLGDREKCSGTYREFIVYDDDFVYPDFIVKYRRET